MRAILLLMALPALCRAEVITFDFTGNTTFNGSAAPVSGSFSYDASAYGTGPGNITVTLGSDPTTSTGPSIPPKLPKGSGGGTITGGQTFSTTGPVTTSLDGQFNIFSIRGGPVVGPAASWAGSDLHLDFFGPGQIGGFSASSPPTSFTGTSARQGGIFIDAWPDHGVRAYFSSVTERAATPATQDTPEPCALLLGGAGALLCGWGVRRGKP
jgi:hypothetical protein